MSRPPKPFTVIQSEGKSHRTKSELNQRKQGEESIATGIAMKERPEVKDNPIAHREFKRINELLQKIQKNDAIYELIINRYCIMHAECFEMEERRDEFYNTLKTLRETAKELTSEMNVEERSVILLTMASELGKITTAINNIDKILLTKRKMLLDIEKENIMTIAAALRSIPKKEESKGPSLADILNNG